MRIAPHSRPSYAFCRSAMIIFYIFGMIGITRTDLSERGFPINSPNCLG